MFNSKLLVYQRVIVIIIPSFSHHSPIIIPLSSHHYPISIPLSSHYHPSIIPLLSHYYPSMLVYHFGYPSFSPHWLGTGRAFPPSVTPQRSSRASRTAPWRSCRWRPSGWCRASRRHREPRGRCRTWERLGKS